MTSSYIVLEFVCISLCWTQGMQPVREGEGGWTEGALCSQRDKEKLTLGYFGFHKERLGIFHDFIQFPIDYSS